MRDADLTPTGRELKDPAATLVECVDSKGLKHTVIAFDEPYRGHEALTTDVNLIMSFMAYPMVTGLVECTAADTKRARFSYPTGTIWTVKEIARGFEQVGQTVGPRAALELCYLSGMVLLEAGETGPLQGCFSHGNLNPWRIGMKADGQLQVFGYGLSQVEMDLFLKNESQHIALDSIRYAPPERLEQQPEQPSSDIYSLAVLALELIIGKPLYNETDTEAMWNAVKLAEGVQRVSTLDLPNSIVDVLGSALVYDPDRRLQGQAFIDAVGNLLDDPTIEGRTLSEVMDRMGNQGSRSKRKLVKATATTSFTMADLAALAAEKGDDEPSPSSIEEAESRWSSLKGEATTGRRTHRRGVRAPRSEDGADQPRRRRKRDSPLKAPAVSTEGPRRRRRMKDPAKDPSPKVESVEPPNKEGANKEGVEAPRRRRRRAAAESTPMDDQANHPEVSSKEDAPRRRRRKPKSSGADTPTDTPKIEEDHKASVPTPDAPPVSPSTKKRRRRRTPPTEEENVKPSPPKEENVEPPSSPLAEGAPSSPPPPPLRRRRRRKPGSSEDTK